LLVRAYPPLRLVPRQWANWPRRTRACGSACRYDNWRGFATRLLNDDLELFVQTFRDLEDDPLLQMKALSVQ